MDMAIMILWNFWRRIVSCTFFRCPCYYSLSGIIIHTVSYSWSAYLLLLFSFSNWTSRPFTWRLRGCKLCNGTSIFNDKSSYILLS